MMPCLSFGSNCLLTFGIIYADPLRNSYPKFLMLGFFQLLQIRDLLIHSGTDLPKARMGSLDYFVELLQEKVENPIDFGRVLKLSLQNRGSDGSKSRVSHLYGLQLFPVGICLLLLILCFFSSLF